MFFTKEFYAECGSCHGEGKKKYVVSGHQILNLTVEHIDNKIEAIKAVRTAYNILGLKEAKELVEHSLEYVHTIQHSLNSIDLNQMKNHVR